MEFESISDDRKDYPESISSFPMQCKTCELFHHDQKHKRWSCKKLPEKKIPILAIARRGGCDVRIPVRINENNNGNSKKERIVRLGIALRDISICLFIVTMIYFFTKSAYSFLCPETFFERLSFLFLEAISVASLFALILLFFKKIIGI